MSTRLEAAGALGSLPVPASAGAVRYLVPVGRLLLAAPFVLAGPFSLDAQREPGWK